MLLKSYRKSGREYSNLNGLGVMRFVSLISLPFFHVNSKNISVKLMDGKEKY